MRAFRNFPYEVLKKLGIKVDNLSASVDKAVGDASEALTKANTAIKEMATSEELDNAFANAKAYTDEQLESMESGDAHTHDNKSVLDNTTASYTTDEKSKLAGIASGANNYSHPTYSALTGVPTANATPSFGGSFSVSQPVTDATGHITALTTRTVTIPSTLASASVNGLMSATDKSKLDGIATGANAYVHPADGVGEATTQAESQSFGGVISYVTGLTYDDSGHIKGFRNKAFTFPSSTATSSASGLMSATDKAKLDGIASGANAYSHPSYTARTGVPSANQTPAFGGTFSVSQPVSDASGHITAVNSRTVTIPSTVASTSKAGLMSATDKANLDTLTSELPTLKKSVADGKQSLVTAISNATDDWGGGCDNTSGLTSSSSFSDFCAAIDALGEDLHTENYADGYNNGIEYVTNAISESLYDYGGYDSYGDQFDEADTDTDYYPLVESLIDSAESIGYNSGYNRGYSAGTANAVQFLDVMVEFKTSDGTGIPKGTKFYPFQVFDDEYGGGVFDIKDVAYMTCYLTAYNTSSTVGYARYWMDSLTRDECSLVPKTASGGNLGNAYSGVDLNWGGGVDTSDIYIETAVANLKSIKVRIELITWYGDVSEDMFTEDGDLISITV